MTLGFDLPRGRVFLVDAVDVRLDPEQHPFERGCALAIARNWEAETAANPTLFNGTVVLLSALNYAGGALVGRCHAVRYATFLYWRKNRAAAAVEHCFAHAVLVSSDNALIAVRMGMHTANAGRVYFAAGSFEPGDFPDGTADIAYNMEREVLEETGLDLAGVAHDAGFHAYSGAGGTVIFRAYRLNATADEIAQRISAFVASEADPEISGPVVISGSDNLPDGLMAHMKPIIDWHFRGRSEN